MTEMADVVADEPKKRDRAQTGLRPKSAPAPEQASKLAMHLYGDIPAFPSWARMKKDEKGSTAPRRNNSTSRQRKRLEVRIDVDDSGEGSILVGTPLSAKGESRPASPGSVLSRPMTPASPDTGRVPWRRASAHSHQSSSHTGPRLTMANLTRPHSSTAMDIYRRKTFRLRPTSAMQTRPATSQGLSGEGRPHQRGFSLSGEARPQQLSHSMSILEKEDIVFRGGMNSPAIKGLIQTQDSLRKSSEQRRLAKVRLIMSMEKQRLHGLKEQEAQRARQADQDHWKREVLSEMLHHVEEMEAHEEEELRRQEAAHLHLHPDAPAARLPKAANSNSLSSKLGFTTRLIHKTER